MGTHSTGEAGGVTRSGRAVCRWTSRRAACCTGTGRHGGRRHGAAGAPSHPGVEDALAGALLEGSLGERAVRRVAVEGAALLLRPRLHVRVHRGESVALAAVPRVVEHEDAAGDLGAAGEARGRRGEPPESGAWVSSVQATRGGSQRRNFCERWVKQRMGAPVVGVRAGAHDAVVSRSGARGLATHRRLMASDSCGRDLGSTSLQISVT